MLLILPVEGGHVTRILSHRELALVFENAKMEQDEIKKTVTELVSWVTFYRSVIGTFFIFKSRDLFIFLRRFAVL